MAAEYQYVPIVYKKKNPSVRYANNRSNIHKQIDAYNIEKKTKAKSAPAKSKVKKAKSVKTTRKAMPNFAAAVSLPYPYYTEGSVVINKPIERPVKKEKTKIKVNKSIISTILLVVFVLAMLVMVLAGNSIVSGVNLENSKISSELNSIKEEIKDIQLDISFAENLESIQNRASILGLGTPRANQIVYINGDSLGLANDTISADNTDEASFVVNG